MRAKDAEHFFGALAKLAVMHRIKLDKASARVYFEALNDIPIELLIKAMTHLVAHAGEFMPNSQRIREVVDQVQDDEARRDRDALRPQRLTLDGTVDRTQPPPAPVCATCEDTGLKQTCPGCHDVNACETRKGVYCANYKEGKYSLPVAPCPCAATNPTIMLKKKLAAKVEKRYAGAGERRRRSEDYEA